MSINNISAITFYVFFALVLSSGLVSAQDPFPGMKAHCDTGAADCAPLASPTPTIGIGKDAGTLFKFRLTLDDQDSYSATDVITDVVNAEFEMAGICTAGVIGSCCLANPDCDTIVGGDGICDTVDTADDGLAESCGDATWERNGNPNRPPWHLFSQTIYWDLDANTACDPATTEYLDVCVVTDKNPGHAKRNIDYYEPTSCGPHYLNEGAILNEGETDESLPSNSLIIAPCDDEQSGDCIDTDGDGWSVECGDCDDTVDTGAAINPDALEICDGVDNDCDGQIDEGDVCL